MTGSICGTPEYISPEMISQKLYSNKIDAYSLGILIYELFTGATPFTSRKKERVFWKINHRNAKIKNI